MIRDIAIPDIGDFKNVPVIELRVKPGDAVKAEDTLLVLESDKAVLEVPSPEAGTVRDVKVAIGDKVSEGVVVLVLETEDTVSAPSPSLAPAPEPAPIEPVGAAPAITAPSPIAPVAQPAQVTAPVEGQIVPHASPSLRRFARELGVDLALVQATGPKGRIQRADVENFIKQALTAVPAPASGAGRGLDLLPWPQVDFAKFGPIERQPLSKIKRISGANLARNWAIIPHVTNFEEADITELEAFRVRINQEQAKAGIKLTLLPFLIKSLVATLKRYPEFNASLDGDDLILKHYFHVGFAADTPGGLVVPVIKDADRKGLIEIANEASSLAAAARDGKLKPSDMQGGSITVSSLGGIGGTNFTPIINAPEIAILGVVRAQMKPVWDGNAFQPRLILPISLSWDHRAVDGVAAARFLTFMSGVLGDFQRIAL